MFIPIDRLPGHNNIERQRYEDRWQEQRGQEDRDRVLARIRGGAGEDFLQGPFELGELPTLENMWDLKGLQIHGETFQFEGGDTFEAIDFSFASFWHTTFENAVFQSAMRFGRIYGCTFIRCIFIYSGFVATRFENCRFIDCDFIEGCGFTNCDFHSATFEGCYLGVPIFEDCRFDAACRVGQSPAVPVRGFNTHRDLKTESVLRLSVSEAYRQGGAVELARESLFSALRAQTRYNRQGAPKLRGYLQEFGFGYGFRPLRVLRLLAAVLFLGTAGFAVVLPLREAFLLAAGAVLTFGVHADRLDELAPVFSVAYTALAFAGISLIALLAAVWARVFFANE